jgi:hypothetical protein
MEALGRHPQEGGHSEVSDIQRLSNRRYQTAGDLATNVGAIARGIAARRLDHGQILPINGGFSDVGQIPAWEQRIASGHTGQCDGFGSSSPEMAGL